jgi:hypothetical protein
MNNNGIMKRGTEKWSGELYCVALDMKTFFLFVNLIKR